ncbi:MAG: T9SS type A sorting domain-containing protein, partial [Salegentibacter sp.]
MKHYYFYSFLLVCFLAFSAPSVAQEAPRSGNQTELPIEGLSIYPNPVTGGKVYISTKKNLEKEIEIYNVLGKPVFKTRLRG